MKRLCFDGVPCRQDCEGQAPCKHALSEKQEPTDKVQRAPTQAGERATLAADQVQANAPESDALPERRTRQVAYPGIDKRKVRGGTPRVDAVVANGVFKGDNGHEIYGQYVYADFARQLERELAEAKRQILMDTECIERIRNAAYETETKLSDAKTVIAGLTQVSEMAHKENAELKRRLDEALDVIERHEAEKKADVLAEREACARICDLAPNGRGLQEAASIRARTGGKP